MLKQVRISMTLAVAASLLGMVCEVAGANAGAVASGGSSVAGPVSKGNGPHFVGGGSGQYIKRVKVSFETATLGNHSYEEDPTPAMNPINPPLREIVQVLKLTNEYPPHEPLTLTYVYYNTTGELQPDKAYTYKDFFINGTGYFSSVYFDAIQGTFAVTDVTTAILSAKLFYPTLDLTLENDVVENHYFLDNNSGKQVHVTIKSSTNGLVTLELEE